MAVESANPERNRSALSAFGWGKYALQCTQRSQNSWKGDQNGGNPARTSRVDRFDGKGNSDMWLSSIFLRSPGKHPVNTRGNHHPETTTPYVKQQPRTYSGTLVPALGQLSHPASEPAVPRHEVLARALAVQHLLHHRDDVERVLLHVLIALEDERVHLLFNKRELINFTTCTVLGLQLGHWFGI